MTYGSADLARDLHVSRETLSDLEHYAELLRRWQARINLVSATTLPDLWRRHMLDSAQLLELAPESAKRWLDLGSGAGFPGLVLAILLKGSGNTVDLVESDRRKCAFLRQVAQETAASAAVHATRAEALTPFPADVITARAFAPLGAILRYAAPFVGAATRLLLPKGQDVEREIEAASTTWVFSARLVASRSDPSGRIVVIDGLAHA